MGTTTGKDRDKRALLAAHSAIELAAAIHATISARRALMEIDPRNDSVFELKQALVKLLYATLTFHPDALPEERVKVPPHITGEIKAAISAVREHLGHGMSATVSAVED